jgi:hypothetical protein
MLFSALVSQRDSEHTAAATASRDIVVAEIGGYVDYPNSTFPGGIHSNPGVERVQLFVTSDPGDPGADPPIPAQDFYVDYIRYGAITGSVYSGTIPQSPGIDTGYADPSLERFYPAVDGPSGVFSEAGAYFQICFEPQHYVNGVTPTNDVNPAIATFENGAYTQYGPTVTHYSNLVLNKYRERPVWPYDSGDGLGYGDGHGMPPVRLPTPYLARREFTITNYDVWGGYWVAADDLLGNVDLGPQPDMAQSFYATNQHGEYTYESRWRTWLSCFGPDKTLRFRKDISRYYIDGPAGDFPSRLQSPLMLGIRQWLANGDHLWILRDDYPDKEPGDDIQGLTTDLHIELYLVGSSDATLLCRTRIHPFEDTENNYVEDGTSARMMVGVNAENKPYATVWSTWNYSDRAGHHIAELLFSGGSFTQSEKWSNNIWYESKPAGQPIAIEAANAVHHGGKLYWIDGGTTVMSKSSS